MRRERVSLSEAWKVAWSRARDAKTIGAEGDVAIVIVTAWCALDWTLRGAPADAVETYRAGRDSF